MTTKQEKPPKTIKKKCETDLFISDDGKTIVDDKNNVIATFSEDVTILPSKTRCKMTGHMKCDWECLRWKGEKCIYWHQTCTFVPD